MRGHGSRCTFHCADGRPDRPIFPCDGVAGLRLQQLPDRCGSHKPVRAAPLAVEAGRSGPEWDAAPRAAGCTHTRTHASTCADVHAHVRTNSAACSRGKGAFYIDSGGARRHVRFQTAMAVGKWRLGSGRIFPRLGAGGSRQNAPNSSRPGAGGK